MRGPCRSTQGAVGVLQKSTQATLDTELNALQEHRQSPCYDALPHDLGNGARASLWDTLEGA